MSSTKEQIVNVSLKLFSEKTYHGASIRDIAKSIERRESSIYNHFSSKEEILNEIISIFSTRNFGKIILTDSLINIIGKPEKFFQMLAENLMEFWNSDKERMFIKILMNPSTSYSKSLNYSLGHYLNDFKKLCEFILEEMKKHKFIVKNDVTILSSEFISQLFLLQLERILIHKSDKQIIIEIKNHVEFFWKAIKR